MADQGGGRGGGRGGGHGGGRSPIPAVASSTTAAGTAASTIVSAGFSLFDWMKMGKTHEKNQSEETEKEPSLRECLVFVQDYLKRVTYSYEYLLSMYDEERKRDQALSVKASDLEVRVADLTKENQDLKDQVAALTKET